MKIDFSFEFEQSKPNSLCYECRLDEDEKIDTGVGDGVPILYLNRPAMLTLAKLLIQMAHGPVSEQFHVHINQDFNSDKPEKLNIMLYPDDVKLA